MREVIWSAAIVAGAGFIAVAATWHVARRLMTLGGLAGEPTRTPCGVPGWVWGVVALAACSCAAAGCWARGPGVLAVSVAVLAGFGVPAVLADVRVRILPGRLTDLAAVGVLACLITQALDEASTRRLGIALACAAGYAAALYALALLTGGIGLGDVRLAVAVGLVAGQRGPAGTVTAAVGAFLLAAVITAPLLAFGVVRRSTRIPFGAFLLAGAMLAVWWT